MLATFIGLNRFIPEASCGPATYFVPSHFITLLTAGAGASTSAKSSKFTVPKSKFILWFTKSSVIEILLEALCMFLNSRLLQTLPMYTPIHSVPALDA